MYRRLTGLFLVVALVVVAAQAFTSSGFPWSRAREQLPPPENPAPQTPGPDLPVPLLPEERMRAMESREESIPATPADPYQYAVAWQQELARVQGVTDPVVVVYQRKLYLAYRPAGIPLAQVREAVNKRVHYLETRFQEVLVSDKTDDRVLLEKVLQHLKAGESVVIDLEQLREFERRNPS
ncbi:MAG TPA: hypothetical protein VHS59_01930 [Bacillota bacterium]|nr:hypothetical protein [Bacillota bacterium]